MTAQRVGSHVRLTWTTSPDTTDGDAMRGPVSAVICRDDSPRTPPAAPIYPVPPDPCKTIHQITVQPGDSVVDDELPSRLLAGAPVLLAYRVALYNVQGRTAGPSAPVYAVAGQAPEPAGTISLVPARNAVLIQWKPATEAPAAPMQLSRTLLATAAGPVAPKKSKPGKPGASDSTSLNHSTTAKQLTLVSASDSATDPGGMFDRGIHDGDTLEYIAQRVLTVKLIVPATKHLGRDGKPNEGKAFEATFELRGEPSPVATITFHATLPPTAPTGLEAVPGGGFGEPPAIDLSWEPNPELDVMGYNVYRAEDGAASFKRLTTSPTPGPAYRDLSAKPGVTYRYRVTAVDDHHNESGAGAPVSTEIPPR